MRTRKALVHAGVPLDGAIQVAADAGYFSTADLVFAAGNPKLVDALIAEGKAPARKSKQGEAIFGTDDFSRAADGALVCPAQRKMAGPYADGDRERWHGVDCATCELKPKCTSGSYRAVTLDIEFHRARDAMRARLALPGARERYNQRIATIEPVFSTLQDAMGFRRVSSREVASVRAEIMLKVLAYNLTRLQRAGPVRSVRLIANPIVLEEARAAS